jgi:N-acyl-D-aspartate/D-glutamate deacylase
VIFDPKTINAGELRRVRDLPGGGERMIADAFGIDQVIVNGVVVRAHGENQVSAGEPLPGVLLRGGAAYLSTRGRS